MDMALNENNDSYRKQAVHARLGFAGMVLDNDGRSLTDATGADVPLTPSEFDLLATLANNPGRALSRDQLLRAVAGREADAFDRSVDVLVGRLRRKIEPDAKNPRLIVTVPGIGYKFALRPVPAANTTIAQPSPAAELDRPSLAILPFTNLSGDPEQDYFTDGMVEEITTGLSRVRWFFVIARNSSFTYKGRAVDVKQVGRELGVRYVLEGSVRKAGNRVRIAVQLAETETGVHVWADRFDGVIENIFELQDEITASVVGAIEPQLRAAELTRATLHRPTNPTAYDSFLRGLARYCMDSREENDATMRLLRSAIVSDPTFAPPYGLAAVCCIHRVAQGWSVNSREDRAFAIEMARTAARLGAEDPTVLAFAGHGLGYFTEEYDLAVSLSEQALALNPNSATVQQSAGWTRLYAGDPETAMVYLMRATRLNPIDTKRFTLDSALAYACVMLGRAEEAVVWARKSLGSAPHWIFPAIPLAGALAMLGRSEEAASPVAQLVARIPRYTVSREVRIYKPGPARDALQKVLTLAGFPP
jgi:adenylate cyclase